MTLKVHGAVKAAESFNSNLSFFKVTLAGETMAYGAAGVDADGNPNSKPQYLIDKVVEAVSQIAQPIVFTLVSPTVVNFTVEHALLWDEAGNTDPKATVLKDKIEEVVNSTRNKAGTLVFAAVTATVVHYDQLTLA